MHQFPLNKITVHHRRLQGRNCTELKTDFTPLLWFIPLFQYSFIWFGMKLDI